MKKIILQDHQLNQLVTNVSAQNLDGKSFPGGAITGDEIIKFSSHAQINNFILFQIYQDWNAMMQKMQHPYFDYEAPDVKEGLNNFLNVLSRNIKVPLEDFKKLLKQAIYNTLKLILNPEDSLGNFFFGNANAIPFELFKKHSVYFKDFDFAVKSLQRFFEKNNMTKVERPLFMEKFNKVLEIFEKKNNTEIYTYQKALFKDLTGQELDPLVEEAKKAAATPAQPATSERKPVDKQDEKDIPDWIKQEQERRKKTRTDSGTPAKEEPKAPAAKKEPESKSATKPESKPAPKAESKPAPEEKTVSSSYQEAKEEKRSINDQFSDKDKAQEEGKEEEPEKPKRRVASLLGGPRGGKKKEEAAETSAEKPAEENKEEDTARKSTIDLFAQAKKAESALKDKKTVAEALGSGDKSSVNKSIGAKAIRTDQIPVHKQFQYVQKVFGGSSVKFKVVLDKINKTENLEEAESVLNRYVFNDPSVNRNDKVCKEFVEIVRERFSS